LALDLQGLLNALAGSGGCGSNGQPIGALAGTNPLAATPLAPLGTELASVLFAIRSAHPGSGGTVLTLGQLSTLTGQLSDQFNTGSATGPTGTPLDSALGALSTLLGPVGGVGQPIDTLLSLIAGAVQTGAGGTPVCPSTNPLLNLLCGL